MYTLKINNPIHWRHSWSAEIGRKLEVQNSSYDTFVFTPATTREEILEVLADVPDSTYQLFEVEPTEVDSCEIWTDEGQCYQHRE